ncbi:hypothetical protein DdX_05448 [Ditylenchus destructor]|uniref:Uncharacterized protein n=1 Tax=Ditylenchus destructor TaxID=166010 RepID=A0AAD4N7A0_9BILA|nr:hypothetical protein DdX_05448 [Ditylenchus destructor]
MRDTQIIAYKKRICRSLAFTLIRPYGPTCLFAAIPQRWPTPLPFVDLICSQKVHLTSLLQFPLQSNKSAQECGKVFHSPDYRQFFIQCGRQSKVRAGAVLLLNDSRTQRRRMEEDNFESICLIVLLGIKELDA